MADATRELFEFELVGGAADGMRFRDEKVPRAWRVPVFAPLSIAYFEPTHFCTLEYDLYAPPFIDHGYSMSDEGVYRLRLVSSVRCECRAVQREGGNHV